MNIGISTHIGEMYGRGQHVTTTAQQSHNNYGL
jgi:hypothetical protein